VVLAKLSPFLGEPRVRRQIFAGDHFPPVEGLGGAVATPINIGTMNDPAKLAPVLRGEFFQSTRARSLMPVILCL
jgi:hypothetical protein